MSQDSFNKGGISVKTEHIFPVIKKWLYSEKDIFLREIVSNASDAITKLKRLASLGEIDLSEEELSSFRINVTLDKDAGTLTVSDNGIGMSEDELKKYLCNIALSGALDFIAKYEGENENESGIIGHFGLGFYSSFMVSDKVEVNTKAFDGSPAVRWICGEDGEYEISAGDRDSFGTDVIMYISDAEKEYLDAAKIKSILNKFCSFMPVEIFFTDTAEEKKEDEEEHAINETLPLYLKRPSECTEEEYNEFYHKVFGDFRDPLFYIHINADYPLNFKGILYFPKIENEYQSIEGQVKLYYNQVFVADNIKEVIPEYLLMLKGVLDCPQLPLNVSRSYLQTNTYVSKVSAHIVKKVADKLNSLCSGDREKYNSVFENIKTFIEYACIRDRKFYDRVKDSILFPLCDSSYKTMSEYLDEVKAAGFENKLFYASDKEIQSQYISLFEAKKIPVIYMPQMIDTQFASTLEQYGDGISFMRVDADNSGVLSSKDSEDNSEALTELFKKISGNDKLTLKLADLDGSEIPAIINVSEESRRFNDMMKMYSMGGSGMDIPVDTSLVINTSSPIYEKLKVADDEALARYVYSLALLSYRKLTSDEMNSFIKESVEILKKI
ncbi:MAG: molecular chaperone HtpG [Ruminococcaceae bacterium]|nr:molecular chaperone HtpG [Oscillospiraceae bacterium]